MILGQLSEYVVSDQQNEIIYLFTSCGVLIAKAVEDYTAVYVYIFAEGIVEKGVLCVDDG